MLHRLAAQRILAKRKRSRNWSQTLACQTAELFRLSVKSWLATSWSYALRDGSLIPASHATELVRLSIISWLTTPWSFAHRLLWFGCSAVAMRRWRAHRLRNYRQQTLACQTAELFRLSVKSWLA